MENKTKTYIHYGHKAFDKDKFQKIENRPMFNKPFGGFWASATDAEYGWKAWNEDEQFVECDEENSFTFRLKPGAKVLVIDSVAKARKLPLVKVNADGLSTVTYDFEELAKAYDAVEYLVSKDHELYYALYGWDCDSLLVMNKDCVVA